MLDGFSFPLTVWQLVGILLVAGLIGGLTNWLAVRLSFRFTGRGARNGIDLETLAGLVVDQVLSRLLRLDEMLVWMEPEKVAAHLAQRLHPCIDEYVDTVMRVRHAGYWEQLPLPLRRRLYRQARRALPLAMDDLVDDLVTQAGRLVDIRALLTRRLASEPELAVQWFREMGHSECRLLPVGGLVAGVLLGLPWLLVLAETGAGWALPLLGIVTGIISHRLALLWLQPALSRTGSPGHFLKRRQTMADLGARLVCEEWLSFRHIMEEMLDDPQVAVLVGDRFETLLEGVWLGRVGATARLARWRAAGRDKAVELVREMLVDSRFSRERGRLAQPRVAERLAGLAGSGFRGLLSPLFRRVGRAALWSGAALGVSGGLLAWWFFGVV